MDLYERLSPLFQDVFEDDDIVLTPKLNASMVNAWDSLNHIRLIVTIEQTFDIRFDTAEIADLRNVGELVNLIEGKLA